MHEHQHHDVGVSPVLDIGGDVGALVVHLQEVPASGELEACPVGQRDHRFHTGVHLRHIGERHVPVAVYPAITEGDYELLDGQLSPIAQVQIKGGQVTELRL